jgi:hypothetical protein
MSVAADLRKIATKMDAAFDAYGTLNALRERMDYFAGLVKEAAARVESLENAHQELLRNNPARRVA